MSGVYADAGKPVQPNLHARPRLGSRPIPLALVLFFAALSCGQFFTAYGLSSDVKAAGGGDAITCVWTLPAAIVLSGSSYWLFTRLF